MSAGSGTASGMCAGVILCVAHTCAIAAVSSSVHVTGDFVVEKISAVPSMTIRAMVQTSDGYLWFGTYSGLARFDGVRVVPFTVANTTALSSDSIRVLYEDRMTNLWIGTDDAGIMRYHDGEFFRMGP